MNVQRILTATGIGDGVVEACGPRGFLQTEAARVVGRFSSGFYVGFPSGLFAVGGPTMAAGPLHLIIERAPPPPREGSLVRMRPEGLWTDTCMISFACAVRYRPRRPSVAQMRTIAPVLARLGRPEAVHGDVANIWGQVRAAVESGDFHSARRSLQGVGGGLTPTGDDVLAGLILFLRWSRPLSAEPTEVARHARTNRLSRSFLAWAAVGQSIQPVHDLIEVAEYAASPRHVVDAWGAWDRFERTVAKVMSIGGSSGQGLLSGLGLAAETQFRRTASLGA